MSSPFQQKQPYNSVLLHVTDEDIPFLPTLKSVVKGRFEVHLSNVEVTTATDLFIAAKQKKAEAIATTSQEALMKLLKFEGGKAPTIDDYQGSIIPAFGGMEVLILPPVQQLHTVPHGKFLYDRYLRKYSDPSSWLQVPEFKWEVFDPSKKDSLLPVYETATFIACDIETGDENERIITCISFAAFHINARTKQYTAFTIVVPFTSLYNVAFARTILGLSVPKVFQNGKYDNAYLLRYNSLTYNWAFDTINLFHSWYSELPKTLGFITAFMLRNAIYWKNLAHTTDWMQYYEYNARDSYNTGLCLVSLLAELPPWALSNYLSEFPLVFPCVLTENTGLKRDIKRMGIVGAQLEKVYEREQAKLQMMVNCKNYNPNSSQQNARLWEILGSGDIKGTGKVPMDKVAARHPLNRRIVTAIKTFKENKKLDTSYIDEEKLWHGRMFYNLNPHATDTGRMASRSSHFWCGDNIQVTPRDTKNKPSIKQTYVSDDDFFFGEADYRQNEAWWGAFISGDPKYINAVSNPIHDFHSYNASEFFGLDYSSLCTSIQNEHGDWRHDRIQKDIIDIEKRVIYGTQYNMTASVLLDTMGIDNVIRAKRLLKLPSNYSLINVAQYLLNCFDKTYPHVRGHFYDKIKEWVSNDSFLVSFSGHHRYCFGDPSKNKRDMNRYAAHIPQHAAAEALNTAYRNVFYRVWMRNSRNFKLGPQIHDSIFFQYRRGHTWLAFAVKREMELTHTVTDSYGEKRQLFVPVDLKGEANRWNELVSIG